MEPVKLREFFGTWFKILFFIGGLVYAYADLKHELRNIPDMENRVTQIERYLSTRDPEYWKIVKQEN